MKPKTIFLSHLLIAINTLLSSCITTRHYTSQEQFGVESSISRGVHFQFTNEAGKRDSSNLCSLEEMAATDFNAHETLHAVALGEKIVPDEVMVKGPMPSDESKVSDASLLQTPLFQKKENFFDRLQAKIALKFYPFLLKKKLNKAFKPSHPEDCDIIILKNGKEINAKVIEITPDEIKYKRCDYLTGPVVTVTKSEVFMIKYANGEREVFEAEEIKPVQIQPSTTTTSQVTSRQIDHPSAKGALIAGILGLFIFPLIAGIIAVVLGNRVSRDASYYPGKYTEMSIRRGRTGAILGYLSILWVLLLILIIVYSTPITY
ncbi:MAG TPA: hypothetical protein VNJ07_06740 [Chitinophagales bacterium]|nr:hypothetical protein [Chitinophagales bacterium]